MVTNNSNFGGEGDDRPLIQKIRTMLEKTDPEKWTRFDEPLDPERRFPKPRQSWERAYTLKIPKGTLLLRASQPVKSDYIAGGFVLTPAGPERFTVELRGVSWEAIVLVDPYVSGGSADKRCEILAEGLVAQELLLLIAGRIRQHLQNQYKSFASTSEDLLQSLPSRLGEMDFSFWEKKEDKTGKSYRAVVDEVKVVVCQELRNGHENFYCTCQKADLSYRSSDYSLSRRLFEGIEQLEQEAGLFALSEALEDVIG